MTPNNNQWISINPYQIHESLYQKITYKYIHKQYRTPNIASHYAISHNIVLDWLALHLKFGSVYFQQFGGISRPHVDQLQI